MITTCKRTYERENILDLVFSSHPAFISHVSIIPGISDHDAVLFNFSLREISYLSSNYNVYLYHKGDYDSIKRYMNTFSESFLSSDPYNNSVKQNWLLFKVAIQEAIDKHIPQRRNKSSRHIPWINHSINHVMKDRKQ